VNIPTVILSSAIKPVSFWGTMVSRPTVLLISGRAGVGKTTLAGFLKNELLHSEISPYMLSFATNVKLCANEIYGWDWKKDDKGRKLLQDVGRIGRDYNPNIWVDKVIDDITDAFENKFGLVIIDDWRFPNELTRLVNNDVLVYTFRVLRNIPDLPNGLSNDISEKALLDDDIYYDFRVSNYGTIDELKIMSEKITKHLLRKEE
jgi:DNA polymerase III delta prime subunit